VTVTRTGSLAFGRRAWAEDLTTGTVVVDAGGCRGQITAVVFAATLPPRSATIYGVVAIEDVDVPAARVDRTLRVTRWSGSALVWTPGAITAAADGKPLGAPLFAVCRRQDALTTQEWFNLYVTQVFGVDDDLRDAWLGPTPTLEGQ
jgi:hypothetical protein